jgi:hypothetical protein
MAYPPNHTFSAPVELHLDEAWNHARLFSIDWRHNALDVNTGRISGSHVVTVTDDPGTPWDEALQSAGIAVLGQLPGNVGLMARAAYIRSALRPASQGEGRARFR